MHFWQKRRKSKNHKSKFLKFFFELLHQRLGHRSRRSLLAGNNGNSWKDIEIRVDPDPLCTSCQISTINKKSISKTSLKFKTPKIWVFVDIIPATSSKNLTKYTTLSNYLLILGACCKIPIIYGMENTATEAVIENIDMFKSIFGKVDGFGWWDMKRIQTDADTHFIYK